MASAIYRRIKGKPIFPGAPSNSRFVETWASGSSLRNLITRLGGARGCLHVAVTQTSLEIHPHFPFSLLFLPEICDLDIDVPLTRIRGVRSKRFLFWVSQIVEYSDESGRPRRVQLLLKNSAEFRLAVGK